jgi:hypothetical protein
MVPVRALLDRLPADGGLRLVQLPNAAAAGGTDHRPHGCLLSAAAAAGF